MGGTIYRGARTGSLQVAVDSVSDEYCDSVRTQVDKQDAEQLYAGRIISFARPDRYVVEWSDKSRTEYGYSDLFPREDVPIVLPFGIQLDKSHSMVSTPIRSGRQKRLTTRRESKRAKSGESLGTSSTVQAASVSGSTDLTQRMESVDSDTFATEMEATVPAIRYRSDAAAALPSRHDDDVTMSLAAGTTAAATATADWWPNGALGPKPDDYSQDPCMFLRRGELPVTAQHHTAANKTVHANKTVQQQASRDFAAEYSKTSMTRTPWSSSENKMLREMVALGSKPTAISAALNAKFHCNEDVRNRNNVDAAWRRLQRKARAESASTAQIDVDTEYVVAKIFRKRWLGTTAEYEVRWEGYEETTWEPVSSLTLCIPAIEFERLQCNKQQSVRLFCLRPLNEREHS